MSVWTEANLRTVKTTLPQTETTRRGSSPEPERGFLFGLKTTDGGYFRICFCCCHVLFCLGNGGSSKGKFGLRSLSLCVGGGDAETVGAVA